MKEGKKAEQNGDHVPHKRFQVPQPVGTIPAPFLPKIGKLQKELAEKMGVKQSLVSRWESGECNYTIDTLVEIANALKLSVQCPLTFDEVSVSVQPFPVRSQSIHTVVSEETEFSNALRIDFKKVAPGGIAS